MNNHEQQRQINREEVVREIQESHGDSEYFDDALRELISAWAEQEYYKLGSDAESVVGQIGIIISEAELFADAGHPRIAISCLWNALQWAEQYDDENLERSIKSKMLDIDPSLEFEPKQ